MRVEYAEKGPQDIDLIASLWDKLRIHQQVLSPHFSEHYGRRTWAARKAELLEASATGHLRVDVATDMSTGEIVGYCVGAVSQESQGRLESIYVEPAYRKSGIGDRLMQRALSWMDKLSATTKTLIVGAGNEAVLTFYSRYGFFPKHITLEQVERMPHATRQTP